MPHFSVNWFDHNIANWSKELTPLKGKANLRFLEIGCFEGRATRWLLENILTGSESRIEVIDPFEGSAEHREGTFAEAVKTLRQTFEDNIAEFRDRVTIHQAPSHDVLPHLTGSFDFIYVDGSHHQDDVYLDAVLAWPLLKRGGILAFDDYQWQWQDPRTGEKQAPKIGVDRFLLEHLGEYALIHKRWQLHIVRKPVSRWQHELHALRWNPFFSHFPIRKSQLVNFLRRFRSIKPA